MKPLFVICEDGTEYLDRFERFLGGEFRFLRTGSFAALVAALADARGEGSSPAGLILDLDFRRTPAGELVDDAGAPLVIASAGEQQRVSAVQGLFILRALRAHAVTLPALLCTDIDDPGQLAHLETELSPLGVVPSSESLTRLAARLRKLAAL